MSIICIFHRLDEVLELSDRITVLRDGVIRDISFDLRKGEILVFNGRKINLSKQGTR